MEEISSLDSFHTDGDSNARQANTTPKLDEELSQNEIDKNFSQRGSGGVVPEEDNEEFIKNVNKGELGDTGVEEHSMSNDDDFEQISEGSFELDENSQATSTEPIKTFEKTTDDTDDPNAETENGSESKPIEAAVTAADPQEESENFEEVDANQSTVAQNVTANESDMLGESDMTLPTTNTDEAEVTNEETDAVDAIEKNITDAMDVDESDQFDHDNVEATTTADVEMPSISNSPEKDGEADDNADEVEEDAGNDKSLGEDESMETSAVCEEGIVETAVDDDRAQGKDVVDSEAADGDERHEHLETDEPKTTKDKAKETKLSDEKANEVDDEQAGAEQADEDDAENEDEPVENVQEPEESDVCLIPDDTETQMTDAEKEQAILARENAEKAHEDEQAEKDADAAVAAAQELKSTDHADEAHIGDARVTELNETATTQDAAETQDPDEPLLEEMQSAAGTELEGSVAKIIIAWIVSTQKKCKQCGQEKFCGFRLKQAEEYEYLCESACCESLMSEDPGKYFIRRKKFLVEEITSEPSAKDATTGETVDNAEDENTVDNADQSTTDKSSTHRHCCLQCKEIKVCKYFLKQEAETFYICNDDCFNLLNAEEPDKFKLKRHSIRVRNIGATTISSGTSSPSTIKKQDSRVVARTAAEAETARVDRVASFTRSCAECSSEVVLGDKHLLWETMDFCNEICLGKYQRTIGASCQTCSGEVSQQALGKYCVRFGFDVRQFCCAACLNIYKKGLKTCSCCQKDISSGHEGFLAPVGDKEQFKDFCSQACMRRYDSMCNPKKKLRNENCAVCNNDKPVRAEIMLDDKEHYFCSNPCFSAFKFVSNIVADQCGMCAKYFERKASESFTIYTQNRPKVYCSRICLNVYIIVNRNIVSCQWCKVKKYNFDMIYKQQDTQEILMCSLNCLTLYGVSINAFSRTIAKCDNCNNSATPQYHLTMSDASMRNFCTYQCVMQFQSQFARVPLTLENDLSPTAGGAQQQPQQTPQQLGNATTKNGVPFPTGLPKRVKMKMTQQGSMQMGKMAGKKSTTVNNKKGPTIPVISTVASLASGETETMIGSVTVRRGRVRGRKIDSPPPPPTLSPAVGSNAPGIRSGRLRKPVDYTVRSPSPVLASISSSSQSSKRLSTTGSGSTLGQIDKGTGPTETKIITVPPYPPAVRNVQTSCKPQTVTVGFQCKPTTREIACQTDKDYSNKVLIPVPVPIYVPQPMYMYSAPFPVPVPIPLPIPVPIFVPTTRNSAQGILKEIKKIQDKMPTDPLEAELLMMAEMVAEEKHDSDSDSDEEIKPDPAMVTLQYTNSVHQQQQQQQQPQDEVEVTGNNSYGEDMLQIALKLATSDYDPPTVDLESAMTANTITNPPPGMVGHDDSLSQISVHHLQQQQQQQHLMLDTPRSGRGRKRGAITSPIAAAAPQRNNRSPVKRARLQELESSPQHTPQHTPQQPLEKPDANLCLKYTFGVNAWKQWVMTKNADIEKSSIRRRTFKTELLQMTADELNYSLCLFVKEVRKPNGTEYAPDTIYYLVLGIQQYLYENGRIDNIFYDPYYERFTDCLDEVARKFSVLYNDSQYIVTRVEEEHLWECKQLGAHSPHVLLSTLMFFNTKHFNLTTVEEHMQLSFSHIMKHWKRSAQTAKMPGTRNVLLRFYPPQAGLDANPRKKKVYEQQENEENPLRCPVRLYEFYLSKCPESVKTRNDVFYLQPERSCVPDSPVWYSTQALSQESLQKMLHRVKMVKEINIALLTS